MSAEPESPPSEFLELLGETQASSSSELEKQLVGKVIGGCRVESLIGAGGMGAVFRAHHLGLDRPVAIKVLPHHLASTGELVDRFVLEARSVARIEHPNLVQVYDIRVEEGLYYIIMQFVDGADASAVMMERGPYPPEQALTIIIQAARALDAIHAKGVIHRDLKPTNLLISSTGQVKITDLGLVKLLRVADPGQDSRVSDREPGSLGSATLGSATLGSATLGSATPQTRDTQRPARDSAFSDANDGRTRLSTRIGTPAYMAPEQATPGEAVDERADIYALGATLFHLLTGRPPFEGPTTEALFEKQRLGPVPNPRSINPWVPTRLCQVIGRMMAKKPGDRYQSASELLEDLEALSESEIAQEGPGLGYSLSRPALKLNAFLVSTVLEQKRAQREQIEQSLRLQSDLVAFGSPRSLAEIFLEKGILTQDQMDEALKSFRSSELQRHNSLFGRIAVGAGRLAREGLREGLKAQRAMARAGHGPMRLGEVLVRSGFLTAEMVDVILRAQENYVRSTDDSFFEQAARRAGVDLEAITDAVRRLHAVGGDDPRSLLQVLLEHGQLTPVAAQELVADQVRNLVDVMTQPASAAPRAEPVAADSSPADSGAGSPSAPRAVASALHGGERPRADPSSESTEITPGPWGWLSPGAEASDGVSLQTLLGWIAAGRITADSMVRGPTTGGRWAFASRTPGVSKFLGLCPHCERQAKGAEEVCAHCGRFLDWPALMTVSDPLAPSASDSRQSLREWSNG